MQTSVKKINKCRRYSEEFKKELVSYYETGEFTINQLGKLYSIANTQIYNWIYKYSLFNEKSVRIVEMKTSNSAKLKEQEMRIKELERIVGQKQITIDYLDKLIEIASKDLQVDIKKNTSTQRSSGSKAINKKRGIQ
jgi:transposase